MPYIKSERRTFLNREIGNLVDKLRDLGSVKGDVNYTITRVVLGAMCPESGWSYQTLSDAVAALKDAATEVERRLLAPYEDKAKERNGDVPEYGA